MMPHDLTTTATARLRHWWELHGAAEDAAMMIRQIAHALAPTRLTLRQHLEDLLGDEWARLCAQDGDDV